MSVPIVIDSNITGLSYAEEESLATLSGTPTFYALEPNSYNDFGGKFTAVAREPIIASRQKLQGSLTTLEANAGFTSDLTQHNLKKLLQGFFFAALRESPSNNPVNGTQNPITGVTVSTNTTFAAAAGLATVGVTNRLVKLTGFNGALNTGLQVVNSGSATTVVITGALTVEAAPPTTATIKVVGQQGASGDFTLAVSGGGIVTLNSTALDFTTLPLTQGQWVYVGGDTAASKFLNAANTGYARISTITAHVITFDIVLFAAVADAGTAKTVQIFFGDVLRNEQPSLIVRRTYTLERTLGINSGVGSLTQAEYVLGAVPNECTLTVNQASKITCDTTFVGMNYQYNDSLTGLLASGTRTNVAAPGEAALNTSSCVYATRLYVVNTATSTTTPLYAYIDDMKVVINNNIKGDKAIGVLGNIEASVGDFAVSLTASAYFTNVDAMQAIVNYQVCAAQLLLANNNMGMALDIPQVQISGGLNKVEKNKPIMADLTGEASMCPNGYTAMLNFFEYLPTAAMPVVVV
ncbi:MAG: phage tail tube protein [Minisyncoccia bacterium]